MGNFFKILGVEGFRNVMTRDELLDRLSKHSRDKHYVYVIWRGDKQHTEPMYVGKGKGRRIFAHFYKSDQVNPVKKLIFEKMRKRGVEPLFSLLGSELTDDEAMALESETIHKLGRIVTKNGPLANLTEGGEGQASTRARRGQHGRARAVFAAGVRYELLTDAAAVLGVYPSAIHKRINAGWEGYYYEDVGQTPRTRPAKHSADHIQRMRSATSNKSKRVIVHGREFKSMSAAAEFLGVNYATIRNRCSDGTNGFAFVN